MPAYVVVNVDVTDKERYARYIELAPPTIGKFGGKYIARGGRAETLEGEWTPKRFVVLEFESLERAKAWWASEEYAAPKALRQSASTTNMIVVEGLTEPFVPPAT
ncbi:MAG: DUF1330 domain-containing protein [Vicinamibacterales bacterium]